MRPSRAGSKVVDVSIVASTVADTPTPIPDSHPSPTSSRPSIEITTVVPANTTARPAVPMATTVASRGASPAWTPSRYRVTTNSA